MGVVGTTSKDGEDAAASASYTFQKFSMFNSPKNMRQNGTSEQCLIEIEIEHMLNEIVVATPAAANGDG